MRIKCFTSQKLRETTKNSERERERERKRKNLYRVEKKKELTPPDASISECVR